MAMLGLGVAGFALGHTGTGPAPIPQAFDRYLGLGNGAGSRTLRADLARDHPHGSDLGSLLMRLTSAGFECRQDQRPTTMLVCNLRRAMPDGRVGLLEVMVKNNGVAVDGITGSVAFPGR